MSVEPEPPVDPVSARLGRAQEMSAERIRNGQLQVELASLRSQLDTMHSARDRFNAVRFVALCLIVLLGLAAVVYIQVDSRGSGRLRAELIRQCEIRNSNTVSLQAALTQAAAAEDSTDVARQFANAAAALRTTGCDGLH